MHPKRPSRVSRFVLPGFLAHRVHFAILSLLLIAAGCRQAQRSADALERAYRANNQGVALLERFQYAEAADAFRRALQVDDGVAIARFNLSLALLYAQDLTGATREAAAADRAMPAAPQ